MENIVFLKTERKNDLCNYCFRLKISKFCTILCSLIDIFKWFTLQETGILLNDEEINQLIMELDRDGDGEINYR